MAHQYKLLECMYGPGLSNLVTSYLAEGWDLWGNPFVVEAEYDGDIKEIHYFQAVVRFEPENQANAIGETDQALNDQSPAGYSVQVPETPAEPAQAPAPPTAQDFSELVRTMISIWHRERWHVQPGGA